jgi:hypothetical protein
MSLAEKILKLFRVNLELNKENAAKVLQNATGEHYRDALLYILRESEKTFLEELNKDQLVTMLLGYVCPLTAKGSNSDLFDEMYDGLPICSMEDFVAFIDLLPADLRS